MYCETKRNSLYEKEEFLKTALTYLANKITDHDFAVNLMHPSLDAEDCFPTLLFCILYSKFGIRARDFMRTSIP